MKPTYPFDVIPIRPKVQYKESLSSYLTRLAEANGIKYKTDLAALLFQSNAHVVNRNPDYPPLIWDEFLRATNLTSKQLKRMTFAYFGNKFALPPAVQGLKFFLRDSVCEYLRFCPLCLREDNYYRLTWRFNSQIGCSKHRVYLEERCYKCDSKIPLIASPFKIGVCPICGANFAEARSTLLPFDMQRECTKHDRELTYLLTPQWWDEQALTILKHVRRYIRFWRRSRGLSLRACLKSHKAAVTQDFRARRRSMR